MVEPRFIADAMLGRLARYLRFLGYDTLYDADEPDSSLVERARAEDRILLTRDGKLVRERRPRRVLLIEGDDVLDQLRQVVQRLSLARREPVLERCSVCNVRLRPAPEKLVLERVPAGVRRQTRAFARCPSCGRVYWDGSHMQRLRERVRRAMG